jgi:hypothetical protein
MKKKYMPVSRARRFYQISDATGIHIHGEILDDMFNSGASFRGKYPHATFNAGKTVLEIGNVKTTLTVEWDKDVHKFFFLFSPDENTNYATTKVFFSFSGAAKHKTKQQKKEYDDLNYSFAKAIAEHYGSMESKNLRIAQEILNKKDKAIECISLLDSLSSEFGDNIYSKSDRKIYDDFRNSVQHDSMEFGALEKICGGQEWNRITFQYQGGSQGVVNEDFNGVHVRLPVIKKVNLQNVDKVKEIIRLINDINS